MIRVTFEGENMAEVREKVKNFMRTRDHVCQCERVVVPRKDATNVELNEEELGEVEKILKDKFGGTEFKLVPVREMPDEDEPLPPDAA